jgi:hypothetical protein
VQRRTEGPSWWRAQLEKASPTKLSPLFTDPSLTLHRFHDPSTGRLAILSTLRNRVESLPPTLSLLLQTSLSPPDPFVMPRDLPKPIVDSDLDSSPSTGSPDTTNVGRHHSERVAHTALGQESLSSFQGKRATCTQENDDKRSNHSFLAAPLKAVIEKPTYWATALLVLVMALYALPLTPFGRYSTFGGKSCL